MVVVTSTVIHAVSVLISQTTSRLLNGTARARQERKEDATTSLLKIAIATDGQADLILIKGLLW